MYLLQEKSLKSEDPIFKKLKEGCIFFPEKTIAYDFANTGYYERVLMNWCKENFCDSNKIFLDIGSHVGTYSIELANGFKHVHAFECSKRTYNFLCANIALNNLDYQITTHNTALGDKIDKTKVYLRNTDGGGNGCLDEDIEEGMYPNKTFETIDVEMKTLDSFKLNDIGFIKIDVEGFELHVLKGAEETLKRNNYPKFIFECWRHFKPKQKLFSYIESLGYRIVFLNGFDEMFLAEYNK